MKYLFRPWRQMFNFAQPARSTRVEFFAFVLPNFILTVLFSVFLILVVSIGGQYVEGGGGAISTYLSPFLFFFFVLTQLPTYALVTRRMRDAYAPKSMLFWMAIPFLGPVVLFFVSMQPTFVDYVVGVTEDGTEVMRSHEIAAFRTKVAYGAAGVAAIAAKKAYDAATAPSTMQMQPYQSPSGGSSGSKVNRNASAFKADGSINHRTSILGTTKAHMRNGRPVKTGHRKYKM
jgi:uncharacterized membrane protein YhaH (DUF805 family)